MLTLDTLRNGLADAVNATPTLPYSVADDAPSTLEDVQRCYSETGRLVVWSGASDGAIFDPATNWRFRAWHDSCHIWSGLGFTVADEVELARYQAAPCSDELARVVLCEVAEQARHYQRTGAFVADQIAFTLERIAHVR